MFVSYWPNHDPVGGIEFKRTCTPASMTPAIFWGVCPYCYLKVTNYTWNILPHPHTVDRTDNGDECNEVTAELCSFLHKMRQQGNVKRACRRVLERKYIPFLFLAVRQWGWCVAMSIRTGSFARAWMPRCRLDVVNNSALKLNAQRSSFKTNSRRLREGQVRRVVLPAYRNLEVRLGRGRSQESQATASKQSRHTTIVRRLDYKNLIICDWLRYWTQIECLNATGKLNLNWTLFFHYQLWFNCVPTEYTRSELGEHKCRSNVKVAVL